MSWDVARLCSVNLIPFVVVGAIVVAERYLCGREKVKRKAMIEIPKGFSLTSPDYSINWEAKKDGIVTIKGANKNTFASIASDISTKPEAANRAGLTKLCVTMDKVDSLLGKEHTRRLHDLFPDCTSVEVTLPKGADKNWKWEMHRKLTGITYNRG